MKFYLLQPLTSVNYQYLNSNYNYQIMINIKL